MGTILSFVLTATFAPEVHAYHLHDVPSRRRTFLSRATAPGVTRRTDAPVITGVQMRCSCRGSGKWEVNEIARCLVAAPAVSGWITVAQGQAAFGAGNRIVWRMEASTSDTTLKCRYSVGRGYLSCLNIAAPAQARDDFQQLTLTALWVGSTIIVGQILSTPLSSQPNAERRPWRMANLCRGAVSIRYWLRWSARLKSLRMWQQPHCTLPEAA